MDSITLKLDSRVSDVEKYWKDLVPLMVSEEAGELLQSISKYERFITKKYQEDPDYIGSDEEDVLMSNMEKEIADLFIIIGAYIKRHNLDDMAIERYVNEKLNKKY